MKLSACLIVKNEQAMLPRCLESIGFCDEIVVVDTGSTDNTVAIAKSYGARVYHHPWQNDFSLHRNQSIQYANGEWILIIDADEQIASDMTRFKQRLDRIPPEISALVVNVNEISQGKKSTAWLGMRFFRKSSGIHYKHAVHNKAVFYGYAAMTDVQLNHYGYSLDPEKMAAKRERTRALLLKRIEDDPEDFTAYYYLVQLCVGAKDYLGAESYGLKYFETVTVGPEKLHYQSVMYFYMAWVYLHLEDGEKAYAWAKKGLELYPDDLDLNYIMARIGYQAERDDLLNTHAEKYFEMLPVIRNRGRGKAGQFETQIDADAFVNRTIYTVDEAAEQQMKQYLEAA